MPQLIDMKITLRDVEPVVWRRILVPADQSLIDTGAVTLGAMGWNASHLFAFEIDGVRFDMLFDDGLDIDGSREMAGVIASDVFKPGCKAAFQYDFGDDWWHDIEVVGYRAVQTGDKPPCCVGGENACPPDDCGGPFGYADLMDAVADAESPDHEEIKQWLGDFDPAIFDLKSANKEIKKALKVFRA